MQSAANNASKRFKPSSGSVFGVSIMDRYIARELTLPFLFGVGAFSSIGISIGALFELIRKVTESGLAFSLALEIFVLRLPEFIVLAFPMSTLLATMLTYSRFSSDSELIALRGCGVSVRRIIAPAIVLSLLVTGVTFSFNELITPAANYRAAITLERALKSERPPFQERNIFYREFQPASDGSPGKELGRLFYARKFNGKEMQGVTILDFSQSGLNQIISAESATWNVGKNLWNFYNGTAYLLSPDGSFANIAKFNQEELQLSRNPFDLASRNRDDEELNIAQATRYLKIIRQSGDEREIRIWELRIQQKYAIPFICIVFGIVGSSLGVTPRRASKATSFGVSVVIIFGYYLLSFTTSAMGEAGFISPMMAAWAPVFVGLGIGVLLLARVSR
ncbi:MAG: LptF/LptG family permease [Leptolyngbyaceae cyanobacterium MO_188.B28]|nr:LptF/LptG family permease [Leptolyngbyaceae cyanobacterium MO_188.B28]